MPKYHKSWSNGAAELHNSVNLLCGTAAAELNPVIKTITDKLIETGSTEEQLKANQQVGDKVRGDFLKYSEIFATYQKGCNSQEPPLKHDDLEAMTTAVTKMADVLGSRETASHGLEKLSVPTWDGNKKSCATWLIG